MIASPPEKTFDHKDLLRVIAEDTAHSTGLEFLRVLIKKLADVLEVRYAFVAEFTQSNTVARVLTFWDGRTFSEGIEYALSGTPCETVLDGEIRFYPEHVQETYPCEKPLGVEGYLAVPLICSDGTVMGHLGVMDTRPMSVGSREMDAFRIFGFRACAEMERKRYEDALRASEDRLSRIVESAMDAIVTIDSERRIQLLNPAAERIFGCSSGWAVGQPFDRFLTKPFRSLMESYLRSADDNSAGARSICTPNGLTALRANREEFPIEGTISSFVSASGQKLYGLILRDVNERMRTQMELDRLQQQNVFLKEEIQASYKFEEMVGNTPAMKQLFETLENIARSDSTVLIFGETGTGKEQIAHAVHNLGARKDRLLVKMNCAALPSELIESELFGHEKGAFTGATTLRKGRFEMADGGTLFLDEVGELSLSAQAKLLRVLQEQEFERVGGTRTIRVDVRVIAATNRNINEMVKAGTYRADLYYRLNVFPLEAPPLRERREDIPLLVTHFLGTFARKLGKKLSGVDAGSMRRMMEYSWPGNIRELQNVLERAAVLTATPTVVIRDGLEQEQGIAASGTSTDLSMRTLEEVESEYIRGVLRQCEWRIEGKRGAAAVLGLEPSTLRYRMQKLGIKRGKAAVSE